MMAQSARRILIGLVILQVVILLVMPVFAGPQIPRDTVVTLAAQVVHEKDDEDEEHELTYVRLDYGFDKIKVPSDIKPFHDVYVELRGDASSGTPMTLGRVVSDPADLPENAIWIKLTREGEHRRVDAHGMNTYYDTDAAQKEQLNAVDSVNVSIALTREGNATINDVEPAK